MMREIKRSQEQDVEICDSLSNQKLFPFFFLPAASKSLTQHMLRGKRDVCSVKGAKSRNKHYQTRKPRDSNQKQFCHCHGMIYDRINKGRKRGTRGRERTMLCTSARRRRQKDRENGGICSDTSNISARMEKLTTATPAFIPSCHCNFIPLRLKRPRDVSTSFNVTDVR